MALTLAEQTTIILSVCIVLGLIDPDKLEDGLERNQFRAGRGHLEVVRDMIAQRLLAARQAEALEEEEDDG